MKKSTVNGIIGLFLAVVLGAGVCCAGFASRDDNGKWFSNGNLSTWHWSDKTSENKPDTPDKPDDEINTSGGSLVSGVDNNGISLASKKIARSSYEEEGISPLADSAYTFTATLTPADADNKFVNWAVAFVNPSATWASGKKVTDYVTVTPTSDGALTANVVCKQAFGAQIKITVTSRANSKATASCTVDYRRKLQYTDFKATALDSASSSFTLSNTNSSTVTWNWLTFSENPYFWSRYSNTYTDSFGSVYTINDTVQSHSIEVKASTALQTALDKVTTTWVTGARDQYKKSYTYSGTNFTDSGNFNVLSQRALMGSSEYNKEGIFRCWCSSYDDDGSTVDEYSVTYYNAIKGALKTCTIDFVMTVKTTMASGETWSKSYNVNVADSSLKVVVSSVSLNKTSFII